MNVTAYTSPSFMMTLKPPRHVDKSKHYTVAQLGGLYIFSACCRVNCALPKLLMHDASNGD